MVLSEFTVVLNLKMACACEKFTIIALPNQILGNYCAFSYFCRPIFCSYSCKGETGRENEMDPFYKPQTMQL